MVFCGHEQIPPVYHLCSCRNPDSNTDQDHLNITSQKKSRGGRGIVLARGKLTAALLLLIVVLAGVDNGLASEDLLATFSVVQSLAGNNAVDFCHS